MDLVLTRGEGVKKSDNLEAVLCTCPFTERRDGAYLRIVF